MTIAAEINTENLKVQETSERQERAMELVHRNMAWAAGGGLIVIPFVDIAAITSVQLKMIKEIAEVYDVPFSTKIGRSLLAAILGGAGSSALAYGKVGAVATSSLMKVVPVVGTIFGVATMSVFATGVTYGIGKVFIRHFERGGSLENLDTEEAKKDVEREVEKHAQENKKGLFK